MATGYLVTVAVVCNHRFQIDTQRLKSFRRKATTQQRDSRLVAERCAGLIGASDGPKARPCLLESLPVQGSNAQSTQASMSSSAHDPCSTKWSSTGKQPRTGVCMHVPNPFMAPFPTRM